jgi:signal transduction histidine kinase
VALGLKLRVAHGRLRDGDAVTEMLDEALAELDEATAELRELARGIHPAVLSDHGLGPALNGLAARAPLDVEVYAELDDRLPQAVETTAYFVATEALTNVIRHARAQRAHLHLKHANGHASLEVRDDGVGGAAPGGGSGLRGLEDRVQAIGGSLEVESPRAGGTVVRATFPVG